MTAQPPRKQKSPNRIAVHNPSTLVGQLKPIAGSMSDDWNNAVANQAIRTLWLKHSNPEETHLAQRATVDAMIGMNSRDEFEGMLIAQLIGCHNASMECFRRAMLGEQSFEGRRENLNQAGKLSRTYGALLESLNRHRGKGQQKVTVEHVHVHSGGQAIVGTIEQRGGGSTADSKEQPHALGYASGETLRSPNSSRDALSVSSNEERAVPDARRGFSRSPQGE